MAASFKRLKTQNLSTTGTLMYTVPAQTNAIILGFVIANKLATEIKVLATVGNVQVIGTDTPIPAGSALNVMDGKMIVESGDQIIVYCSTSNSSDCYLSLVEMT